MNPLSKPCDAFVRHCMEAENTGEIIVQLDTAQQVELVLFIKEGALLIKGMRDFMSHISPVPPMPERLALFVRADTWLERIDGQQVTPLLRHG